MNECTQLPVKVQDRIAELACRVYAIAHNVPLSDLDPESGDLPIIAEISETLKSQLWRIKLGDLTGISDEDAEAANAAIDSGEPGMKFLDLLPGAPRAEQIDYRDFNQRLKANPGKWGELVDFRWMRTRGAILAHLLWRGACRTLSDDYETRMRGTAVYVRYVGGEAS